MTLNLKDAMANIDRFTPEVKAKIEHWYPKIADARRSARDALAGMMLVLNVPPISEVDATFKEWKGKREVLVNTFQNAWKQHLGLVEQFQADLATIQAPAPKPEPAPVPAPAPAPPRKSARLAAKPRINYEEAELEEEKEAREAKQQAKRKAKELERLAKQKAKQEAKQAAKNMERAEYLERRRQLDQRIKASRDAIAAVPRPDDTAYCAATVEINRRRLWLNPESEDYKKYQRIAEQFLAAKKAYLDQIEPLKLVLTPEDKKTIAATRYILGI